VNPRIGRPESFGWVRAPFADVPNALCYELPCGEYIFIPKAGSFCVVKQRGLPFRIKQMQTKQFHAGRPHGH
jgi:hypothetical protein